ncbi:peptidase M15 [Paenibacillus sp. KS1]|uniref:D-alanyl-D-alanine carboxypeptidase family protein n=1 Tax=Paenibacillus sp. KS1 TaxID=1849249 RepID=UPI0008064F33|nr:D-alanyl-D-alanine carboxypeptidase family protein [Paenibacillus sp. KS1]OBY80605.1 peptidase M15 [Paenibacillus sp. KS1]
MSKYPYVGQVGKMIALCALLGSVLAYDLYGRAASADPSVDTSRAQREAVQEWSVPLQVEPSNATASARIAPPSTAARAAALIDVASGRVLYSHNGKQELPMASTTKVMTAIVAIEHGRLEDKVKATSRAVGKEGSSIYLRLGEEMSLNHLLYGLMLRSGNDAAVAIAEHVGGSEEGFVHLMNEKAKLLGLEHTQFRNPHGLDEKGHYTTAEDLARISAYALHNATFREIVRTRTKKAPNTIDNWDYVWGNKNKMLHLYEGADGVKTGYTKGALRCLVSSATRNGQQLVAVTLNDSRDWEDHRRMLDYGFQAFPQAKIVEEGQHIEGQPFEASRSLTYPLGYGEQSKLSAKLVVPANGSLEARLGHQGRLTMYVDKEPIASVDVRRISPDESAPTRGGSAEHTSAVLRESKSGNVLSEWMLVLKRVTGRLFGAA